ncbi:MAG: sodium:proton antiporter [Pirellulales bacterium]|nr:sodium:proton antiporter [Pirellulales bacterium]
MDHSHDHHSSSSKPLLIAIAVVLIGYVIAAAVFQLPQTGAKMIGEAEKHHAGAKDHHGDAKHESGDQKDAPHDAHADKGATSTTKSHDPDTVAGEVHGDDHGKDISKQPPALWMVTPFVLLLGAIAVLPLLPLTEHWWESNKSRFMVAAGLGMLTLLYFLLLHGHPIDGHWPVHYIAKPADGGLNWGQAWAVLANAILDEYIPFMMLLFSLFTISGGIRITGDLRAHPLTNTVFIAVGGLLASFIGTTGAAMLLIRPLLETNRERKHVVHTVIFFIFVVCNCGGCLLPIGDPPLFLGYLRGVDFLWTFNLWPEWLFVNGMLLAMYFLLDRFWHYPHELPLDVAVDETRTTRLRLDGMWPNVLLLLGVVLSVALLDPKKELFGWRPWMYLREIVQLGLIGLSLILGSRKVREENQFNYHAILEVAALFCGIFICMQPALQILGVKGPSLGLDTPAKFFWFTGSLSSVLDNAPTYVVFFSTAQTLPKEAGIETIAGVAQPLLIAISLGAVFMGAMTYIGNGPNFMVKAIAEQSGIKMPSFFGYMVYSCLFLVPLFVLTTFIFL